MQNSEQFDVSTLAWVKDEIDETLNQARISLESFVDDEDDASHLRQFVDLLHQVHGTLNIVEITGAAQFAAEVESLTAKIGEGEIEDRPQGFDLLMRSILLLPDYLESLLGGRQDDSVPLIPLLNEIRGLKGEEKLNPFQYFVPDLKVMPPADFGNKNPAAPIKSVAKKIHHHFQSALLNVLREKDLTNSINKLAVVLEKFSQYAVNDYVRQWIWVSMALVDALKNGQLQLAREHKGVLGKIEQAIKIIGQSGEKGLSKRPLLKLTKAILWHISNVEGAPAESLVGQVQRAFQIGSVAAPENSGITLTSDLKRAVSDDILAELTIVKDTFDLFVRSEQRDSAQLELMSENISRLVETLGLLEQEDLKGILKSQIGVLSKLISGEIEANDETLMGVAGAILMVDSAMKDWGSLNLMEKADASDEQVGDDLVQAEHQKMVRQVMHEAREDLLRVREAVIHYLEQDGNKEVLKEVPVLLKTIIGSMKLLSYKKLAAILTSCHLFIEEQMIQAETMPDDDELDTIADAIMAVEYYLEAFVQSKVHPGKVLEVANSAVSKLGYPAEDIGAAPTTIDVSEETEVEAAEVELSEAGEIELSAELSEDLQFEADEISQAIVAEVEVAAEDTVETVSAEEIVEASPEELAEFIEEVEETESAAESIAEESEMDDEIIEIFIEEAEEEISNLQERVPQWQSDPSNSDILGEIRRSFHTLKGSGRLVGATILGEFAWAFEDMLNKMIDGIFSPNMAIFDLLEQALEALPQLILQFKDRTPPTFDIESLQLFALEVAKTGGVPAEPEMLPSEALVLDEADEVVEETPEEIALEVVEEGIEDVVEETLRIDPVLLEIYESETHAHLAEIGRFIADTEESGDLLVKEPLVRALHTLTGSSRMANVPEVSEGCSKFEKYLKALQLSHSPIPSDGMALLSYSITYIQQVVEHLRDYSKQLPDQQEFEAKAAALHEAIAELEVGAQHSPEAGLISAPTVEDKIELVDEAVEGTESQEEEIPEEAPVTDEISKEAEVEEFRAEISAQIEAPQYSVPPLAAVEGEEGSGDEEDDVLIEIFLEEAAELIDATEETLQEWSDHPEDKKLVKSLQRQLHTLKGGARLSGIKEIGDLSHSLETTFDAIVDGLLQRTPEMFNLLQLAHDRLVTQLEQVRHHQPISSGDDLIDKVNALSLGEPVDEKPEQAKTAQEQEEKPPAIEISPELLGSIANLQSDVEAWMSRPDDEVLTGELVDKIGTLKHDENIVQKGDSFQKLLETIERLTQAVNGGNQLLSFDNKMLIESAFESIQKASEGNEAAEQNKINRELIDKIDQILDLEQKKQTEKKVPDEIETEAATATAEEDIAEKEQIKAELISSQEQAFQLAEEETKERRRHTSRVQHEMVRVRSDLLDELVNFAGEVSIYRSRVEQQIGGFAGNLGELDQTVIRLREQLRHLDIETEAQIEARYHDNVDRLNEDDEEFDPLEFDRFTTMQQLSRSMAESLNDLQNIESSLANLSRETETLLLQQSRVNSELQESLIQTRMMPLVEHAPRLRRVVRQTASELKKNVNLQFSGVEVEMDRAIVTRILAPLEHMLRNSVSHAIESPAQRKKAGKRKDGIIEIKLFQEGSEIVMLISDDGAGINKSAIVKKAIKQGLMNKGDKLSDQEIYHFILADGFTTAEELSQISGRGVGMDVVVSEVKQLGGSLTIDSEEGVGTTFTIRLPLSLTASRALLIKAADHQYAIPLLSVRGIERIEHSRLLEVMKQEKPTYQWVDGDYELHYLSELLGFDKGGAHTDMLRRPLLMVQSGELRMALIVDVLHGSREIVVKSLGTQLSVLPEFSGASIMGDGSVILILDIPALLRRSTQQHREHLKETVVEKASRAEPVVMVVDDSITVRKVTERLLKKQQMQCVTAKDGVDALSQLERMIPDVMLLDIEMPHMDGYELATNMRNSENEAIRNIPIIMITSRTGAKHRQRAMEIGVNAYLGKPFAESDLLENIHHYLPEAFKEHTQ